MKKSPIGLKPSILEKWPISYTDFHASYNSEKKQITVIQIFLHKFVLNVYVVFSIWDVTSLLILTQALAILVLTSYEEQLPLIFCFLKSMHIVSWYTQLKILLQQWD